MYEKKASISNMDRVLDLMAEFRTRIEEMQQVSSFNLDYTFVKVGIHPSVRRSLISWRNGVSVNILSKDHEYLRPNDIIKYLSDDSLSLTKPDAVVLQHSLERKNLSVSYLLELLEVSEYLCANGFVPSFIDPTIAVVKAKDSSENDCFSMLEFSDHGEVCLTGILQSPNVKADDSMFHRRGW